MKADFKDLLARKMAKDSAKDKTKDVMVSSMGKEMTFRKPSDSLVLEIMDEIGDNSSTSDTVSAFKKLIYLTCDMLQDPDLQKELDIKDPYQTVDTIFSLGDVMEIGEQLMDLIDVVGEKVKNS